MTKNLLSVVAALLSGAALVSGCATMSKSSPGMLDGVKIEGANGPAKEIVYIESTGYYLLWSLPLCSGDVRWNDEKKSINGGFALFQDFVGVSDLQNAIVRYAESRNCNLADVRLSDSDTSYAGVSSYSGLIGALFGSSQIGVSGVLIPKAEQVAR